VGEIQINSIQKWNCIKGYILPIATVIFMNFLFSGGIALMLYPNGIVISGQTNNIYTFIQMFIVFNIASFGIIAMYERKDYRDYCFNLFRYYMDKEFRAEVKSRKKGE
jgi:hypothetical protein